MSDWKDEITFTELWKTGRGKGLGKKEKVYFGYFTFETPIRYSNREAE